MVPDANVHAVFTGQPKSISDERGTWTSSIFRDRAIGQVSISIQGLEGDRVAQPYHGGPGAAICVHLMDHYGFWNSRFGMEMKPGYVGENVTIGNITEDQICVGDQIRLGTSLVQVSGPRVPCANLARRIGRPDWVRLTIQENRTGFYLRVLEPGTVKEGDIWSLEGRINEVGSIPAINRCMYLEFDPGYARTMLEMQGLVSWWKEQARQKLDNSKEHWTSAMKHGGLDADPGPLFRTYLPSGLREQAISANVSRLRLDGATLISDFQFPNWKVTNIATLIID